MSRSRRPSPPPVRSRRGPLVGVALAGVLVLAAVVAIVSSRGGGGTETSVAYDQTSRQLSFTAEGFDGSAINSAALRGTPTVVNFYASWCEICDREMPDFERVSQSLGDKVSFVGLNPQSNDNDAAQAAMVARTGITYSTARDPQDEILRSGHVRSGHLSRGGVRSDHVRRGGDVRAHVAAVPRG